MTPSVDGRGDVRRFDAAQVPADPGSAGRPAVSAIVTCFNEEECIAACLDSLAWCDEILVVDSFSTDRTLDIVRTYDKVRLLQRKYYGAAAQKNWAMERARHDWFMHLDADETCTPALRDEIESLLRSGPAHSAYTIRRSPYFLGKRIRFSGWHNDRVIRLVRRGEARYQDRRVHAKMVARDEAPMLRNRIDHDMVHDIGEFAMRTAKYAQWGAAQAWRDRKRARLIDVLGRGPWRFVRTYLLMLGFLDGLRGLTFCLMQACGTYMKWAILWGWQIDAARGRQPLLPEFDDGASPGPRPTADAAVDGSGGSAGSAGPGGRRR